MKFRASITIDEGPLPYLLSVAVPYGENTFKAVKFRFKRRAEAEELSKQYLDEFEFNRNHFERFHQGMVRKLHGEPYVRED